MAMSRLLSTLHFIVFLPFKFSINVLHRFFPFFASWLPWTSRTGIGRPQRATDPASVADRWVRQLEEETGAICESRVGGSSDEDVIVSSGAQASQEAGPGPSTLSSRRSALSKSMGHRVLPNFHMGSYESALRLAEKETRPMCAILVSEEHDDVPEFKRSTLVNDEFIRLLKENEFVVWGGDVRDYEASQAAHKLGATTYPFVAFIALQPRGSRGASSSSSSTLTVLSRHQGPALPSSPRASTVSPTSSSPAEASSSSNNSAPTSASSLTTHLTSTLLPRVTPHLNRLRAVAAERAFAAQLIADQNAAFAASAERDRERLEMAAIARSERELEEQRRMREEAERVKREEEARERAMREKEERIVWWRYARRNLLLPEPTTTTTSEGGRPVRIAIRLPSGGRSVRLFSPSAPISQLYLATATLLIPTDLPPSDDPTSPPAAPSPFSKMTSLDNVNDRCWTFGLVTAFPRINIPCDGKRSIGGFEGLKGGAQVVVEMRESGEESSRRSSGEGRTEGAAGGGSDGYDTEEE